jgi:hypothetical protein
MDNKLDKLTNNLSPGRINSVRFNDLIFIRDDDDSDTTADKNSNNSLSKNIIKKNLSSGSNSSEYDNLNSNDASLKIVS